MKKGKIKALLVLLVIVLAGIYYYVTIPAINIHSTGIWIFILFVLVLILAAYAAKKKFTSIREVKSSKFLKIGGIVLMAVLLVFAAGSILSSPIVNAKQYRNLLTIEERYFSEDIQPVNFSQIPLLDKDSAMILGNRKMGSMVDMVSQFEVSDLYSQINYQEKPVRVTPLVYASPIKWLTNQSQGIPAYIVDSHNRLYLIDGETTLHREQVFGKYISLQPLSEEVYPVTLTGFQYGLKDYTLTYGDGRAISNEFAPEAQTATISFTHGELIVIESRD